MDETPSKTLRFYQRQKYDKNQITSVFCDLLSRRGSLSDSPTLVMRQYDYRVLIINGLTNSRYRRDHMLEQRVPPWSSI